ncbi:hypothetical protein DNI29_14310 [Hymenobacter sediminis]|uniref:alginate O-acetyltransferase AlgX-related protein n=1 Tax=Hymenobacter sediminis TaxID=2218621 RepID=UPI000DA6760F|nr:hypothetical protein [Hymenobacter sediminis]RPD46176.1 hypothetical protein DNI29_14310 [Hymenobacter sediminis]
MALSSRAVKLLLLALLLLPLLLPALQTSFPIVPLDRIKLQGYAEPVPRPQLNWSALLNNTYQPALEHYLESHLGFREVFIRLRNQAAYTFFRVCKANFVLVGEDDVLLDENSILAYLGRDFKGEQTVRMNVRKLKAVQDTLAGRGKLLIFAIAPDKANYFSEYHPPRFRQQPRSQTNYAAYAREMKRQRINVLDLAALFQQWKDTVSYPLFPRGGIHWSGYGITLAADTLLRYMEQRAHVDLPDYVTLSRTVTHKPRDTDNDIARSLNLIWKPETYKMVYPNIQFRPPTAGQRRPNALFVGDSFVWSFLEFYPYIPNLFGSKTQFWYYNMKVDYGARADMPADWNAWTLDRKAEILSQDVIVLLFNQGNLVNFDSGFSANAYELLCPYPPTELKRIEALEQELLKSPSIQKILWERSAASGRDYNSLIREIAINQYELQKP